MTKTNWMNNQNFSALAGLIALIIFIALGASWLFSDVEETEEDVKFRELEEQNQEIALALVKEYPKNSNFMHIGDFLEIACIAKELPCGNWYVMSAVYIEDSTYHVDYLTGDIQFNFIVDIKTGEVIGNDKKDRLLMEYTRDLNQGGNHGDEILGELDREIN